MSVEEKDMYDAKKKDMDDAEEKVIDDAVSEQLSSACPAPVEKRSESGKTTTVWNWKSRRRTENILITVIERVKAIDGVDSGLQPQPEDRNEDTSKKKKSKHRGAKVLVSTR